MQNKFNKLKCNFPELGAITNLFNSRSQFQLLIIRVQLRNKQ